MKIGIAGPIATENIAEFIAGDTTDMPLGYVGAPLMGVIIGELIKNGHRVTAFTTDSSIYPEGQIIKKSGPNFDLYICPARPKAWRFNNGRPGRALDFFSFEIEQLSKAIQEAAPDLIHAHWSYEFALAAINTRIPHLITCHDAPAVILRYTRSPYRAIRYLMARKVFRLAQYFTAVSDYMANALQNYTSCPIKVIPNPLAQYVLDIDSARKLNNQQRVAMVCNGWGSLKNPIPALKAFAKFHQFNPEATLHLFGADFGSKQLAYNWCHRNGINDGMIFHGQIAHRALIDQLSQCDLLLHPALEESFGVVVAEAMALGLPIVAGEKSGAVPWVVGDADNLVGVGPAVLTDVSNPDSILEALQTAMDQNYLSRAKAGYNRARERFTPEIVASQYIELYQKVLNKTDNCGLET